MLSKIVVEVNVYCTIRVVIKHALKASFLAYMH